MNSCLIPEEWKTARSRTIREGGGDKLTFRRTQPVPFSTLRGTGKYPGAMSCFPIGGEPILT